MSDMPTVQDAELQMLRILIDARDNGLENRASELTVALRVLRELFKTYLTKPL